MTGGNNRGDRQRGSLIVELACSSVFFVTFTIVSCHLALIIYGAYINDRACRDAARAAAQGTNAAEALKLANSILEGHKLPNSYVRTPVIVGPITYQDFGGAPPAQTSPFVKVATQTNVVLPFAPLQFFQGGYLQDGVITFKQNYTFPIVRVR